MRKNVCVFFRSVHLSFEVCELAFSLLCFTSVDDVIVRGEWRRTWKGTRYLVHQDPQLGLLMFMSSTLYHWWHSTSWSSLVKQIDADSLFVESHASWICQSFYPCRETCRRTPIPTGSGGDCSQVNATSTRNLAAAGILISTPDERIRLLGDHVITGISSQPVVVNVLLPLLWRDVITRSLRFPSVAATRYCAWDLVSLCSVGFMFLLMVVLLDNRFEWHLSLMYAKYSPSG